MKNTRWLPTPMQVSQETVAVVLGAIAGALIINQWPALKAWLAANYSTPNGVAVVSDPAVTTTAAQAGQAASSAVDQATRDLAASIGWRII